MIIDLEQRSPQWLDWRKTKITASMVPVIMGVSKWQTPYELFMELTGLSAPRETNLAMQRGIELEEGFRYRFNFDIQNFGEFDEFKPVVMQSDDYPWLAASLDGFANGHVLEIKYANKDDHEKAKQNLIPIHYWPQVQAQLLVAGVDKGFYYSCHQDEKVIVPFKKDAEYQKDMIEKCKQFKKCLDTGSSPELCDKDYVPKHGATWTILAHEYMHYKATLLHVEEMIDSIKEKIDEEAAGQNCIGAGIKYTKIVRIGNIDYSKIPELTDVD